MSSTSRASRTCVPEWRWATPARCSMAISISSWKPRSRRAYEAMKQEADAAAAGGNGNGGDGGGDENKLIAERRAEPCPLRAPGTSHSKDFRPGDPESTRLEFRHNPNSDVRFFFAKKKKQQS